MQFAKLDLKIDVEPLKAVLEYTDLWNKYPFRKRGPHVEMTDIWVRYNDIQPYLKSGDLTHINDEHDSVWYPSSIVPLVKEIANKIMYHVQGERLGGILITKLPPNGQIKKHVDGGWHAAYYDKYYVCVKDYGSKFVFETGKIEPNEGEIYWFDNSRLHGVENTDKERIAMIICIKTDRSESCHSDG